MKRNVNDKKERRVDAETVFYAVLLATMFFFALCLGSYAFAIGAIPIY